MQTATPTATSIGVAPEHIFMEHYSRIFNKNVCAYIPYSFAIRVALLIAPAAVPRMHRGTHTNVSRTADNRNKYYINRKPCGEVECATHKYNKNLQHMRKKKATL